MKPTLEYIESLARQAGDILRAGYVSRPGYDRHNKIGMKGEIDLVTEVDHQSEEFLVGKIREMFPSHTIVAEEGSGVSGDEAYSWYIDPIDGTVNFAHGIPIFCVSIGFLENGSLTLGVVYDPLRDECFKAEKGKGAWLNGEAIRASSTAEVEQSLLGTGFPYDIRTSPNNNLDHHNIFSIRSRAVRRLGSAALDICYVASGRFDGYWELNTAPWDIAAAVLIAQEAGAKVTTTGGDTDFFRSPYSMLVANPVLHSRMLAVLQGD
jgi:myo-inositol-1(or 4)-monophosphatase